MNDDPFAGLSSLEATERLARFGPNALKPHRQAVWRQFLGRFANPLVLLLLVASAVSAATGDATSAGVIATIVALSVILDFVQERRAGQAAEQLARQVAQRVRVWRDDSEQQVAADA
ncbi:MAG TPA: cation-transporting P-type ATPase, partial [Ottowia sp.]|nr:cation-transporting P-type ATPase [Ottowia sp.]